MRGGTGPGTARRSVLVWNVVLLAIAALLAAIGFLQYRWIRQISAAMEVRVRSNLESLMTQGNLDFYGELSAICVALQVGPDSGAHDGWMDYLQRYLDWSKKQAAQDSVENIRSNPALIARIYIWETSAREKPRLLLLNRDTNRIEEAVKPPDLEPLLARLQERSQVLSTALRAWELPDSSTSATGTSGRPHALRKLNYPMTGWQFDENLPAIVHPLVHHPQPFLHPDPQTTRNDDPVDWIVIVLDLETIKKEILPELARRYFGGGQVLDYRLAVIVTGKQPRVIYSSDRDYPEGKFGAYDSTMDVFGPPPESTEGQLWESLKNVESLRREDWRNFSGPGWFPVIQYGAGTPPWTLIVQRRAGSLEAVVNRVWRTNLFTGLAVLLLLAASVSLVVLATRRAQRLARLQMNFVTSVSHELRTPLTVMISAAENIVDGVVEEQSEIKEHGGIITGQGHLLLDLVDRILLFAANTAGKNLQSLGPVQTPEILDRVLLNLSGLTQSAGMQIERKIQPDLPSALADPVALSQCLQNLIVNAIKYGGQSKWIGITVEHRENQESPGEVFIHVQDHGIGIRASELQRIFEPFYRSPETLTSNVQGTGLGLTVTQRSVKEMGGKLTVTSVPGAGSTFTIQLPAAGNPPPAQSLRGSVRSEEHPR